MRDNLSNETVQKHIRCFEVPIEEQVATLARTIQHIFRPGP